MDRLAAIRRGRNLELLTIGWNSLEAVFALVAAFLVGSIALASFGLDSVIELFASLVLLWRLATYGNAKERAEMERKALRLVGMSFLVLAIYVSADSVYSLWTRDIPGKSFLGIVVTAGAVVIMPLLAQAKRNVARVINSHALHAESRQTDICAYLSAITLAGLALNAALGWWWVDPVAALVMVPIIGNEAREALAGKKCNCEDERNLPTLPDAD
jgi:divalent metal cation (Fe/Co/Zn/Cd) transporter